MTYRPDLPTFGYSLGPTGRLTPFRAVPDAPIPRAGFCRPPEKYRWNGENDFGDRREYVDETRRWEAWHYGTPHAPPCPSPERCAEVHCLLTGGNG